MNTLLAWFNSPEWTLLVKTLLHTLWQAGGLALLLWLALRRVTTPAARYRLTLGTLAAILGTTLLTWAVLKQSATGPAALELTSPITLTHKPSGISPAANFGEPSVIAYATPIPKPAEETRWSGWLALAWMLGTALMLTRAGIQVAGAERLRRSCKPLEDSRITQLLAEAQRALNLTRRIRVAVTDKLTSPAVVGVIVPTLILPLTLLTTLTPEQIRFILLHELAHIRRGDYFANLFQLFIEALLFFNPAVWWISHQVRREREACCDALAIELSGAPVDYARTLLHVAETVLNPPPAAAPAFSENLSEPSSLTDRIQRLLVPGYRPALRLTWRAMLAAIVVGGTLLFLSAVGARSTVGAVMSARDGATKESSTNSINTNISSNNATPTGILTDSQFKNVLQTIEQRNGVALDNNTEIKFVGDRRPQIQMPWVKNGVTGANNFESIGMSNWEIGAQRTQISNQWFYYRVAKGVAQPATNATFATNQMITTKFSPVQGRGRASISNKLDQIVFDKISFDRQPWTNVIQTLSAEVRKLAPDKRGVNLIVNPNTAETAASTSTRPASTPLPAPLVNVSIAPELTNATLRQVLDALVQSADKPITYQLEEYAVVFSINDGSQPIQLVNRSFHTDANMMAQALGIIPKIIGSAGLQTNELVLTEPFPAATNATQIRYAVSNTFKALGVDLNPAQGKTFFYNDREGTILVRATDEELDLVEAYIAKNTIPPPQVNIKTRWVEIPQNLMTPAWLNAASNAFFLPLADPKTRYNILTEQEMADVRRRIERRDGINLLSEGQVTTLSERQAQISVTEVKTIVTGFSTNKNGAVAPEVQPTPLGPVFDVLPTVTSDGASIRLEVIPTFTEFVGYDTNTAAQLIPTIVNGETNSAMLPLPIFRMKQATHSAVVPDGQTLILGNFTVTEIAKQPNGEMRTTDVTSTQTNLLFILVTPTIIDPAGNRAKPAPILNR